MKTFVLALVLAVMAIPALAQEAGWIGVSIEDEKDRGAIVRRVEQNSPAERAGLKQGDVILEYNRENVVGVQQLTRLVRETPVGRTVDVKVRRDNRDETLKVTADRPAPFSAGRFNFPNGPELRVFTDNVLRSVPRVEVNTIHVQSGIRAESLTDQMRSFFGVTGANGVLVTSVESGSAAATAGLKAGDVIISVGGRNVQSTQEFSREMRGNSKPVLKIVRDKQEREIRVE